VEEIKLQDAFYAAHSLNQNIPMASPSLTSCLSSA
jgi:hypothetical protein